LWFFLIIINSCCLHRQTAGKKEKASDTKRAKDIWQLDKNFPGDGNINKLEMFSSTLMGMGVVQWVVVAVGATTYCLRLVEFCVWQRNSCMSHSVAFGHKSGHLMAAFWLGFHWGDFRWPRRGLNTRMLRSRTQNHRKGCWFYGIIMQNGFRMSAILLAS